jgi:hypothetical protein
MIWRNVSITFRLPLKNCYKNELSRYDLNKPKFKPIRIRSPKGIHNMKKTLASAFLLFVLFAASFQIAYAGTETPTDCPATEPGCPPPPDCSETEPGCLPPPTECPPDDNDCTPTPEDCPSTEPGCPPPPEDCPLTEPGCSPPPACSPDDNECMQTEPTIRKTDYKRSFFVPFRISRATKFYTS